MAEPTWDNTVPTWEESKSLDSSDSEFGERTDEDDTSLVSGIMETADTIYKGARGVAEVAASMVAGTGAIIAAGAGAVGMGVGNLINKTADYMESKLPLGEIDIGDEGITYQPKATPLATKDYLSSVSEFAMAIQKDVGEFAAPTTEEGQAASEWLGEHVAEPIERAGIALSDTAADFFEESDLLPVEAEGAIVGTLRATPEILLTAAPIPVARGIERARAKRAAKVEASLKVEAEAIQQSHDIVSFEQWQKQYPKNADPDMVMEGYARYTQEKNLDKLKLETPEEAVARITPEKETIINKQSELSLETAKQTEARVRQVAAGEEVVRVFSREEAKRIKGELVPTEAEVLAYVTRQEELAPYLATRRHREATRRFEESTKEAILDTSGTVRTGFREKLATAQAKEFVKQERTGVDSRKEMLAKDLALKKEQIINARNRTFEEIEAEQRIQKAQEESLAWEEKAVMDEYIRLEDMALDTNPKLRNMYRNQRGAVDVDVFVEGIYKTAKTLEEFTKKLVKEKGVAYKAIAPALFEYAKNKVDGVPKEVKIKNYQEMNRLHQTAHVLWTRAGGGRSINVLGKYKDVSPSIATLVNKAEHTINSLRPIPADFYEGVNRQTGRLHVELEDIFYNLKKNVRLPFSSKYKGKELNLLLSKIRKNDFEGPIGSTALALRQYLDGIYKYAREAGLDDIKYLHEYFPRLYNWRAIKKDPEGFQQVLKNAGFTASAAKTVFQHIVQQRGVMDISDASIDALLVGKSPLKTKIATNLEKDRLLNIPDAKLAKYLDNNVEHILSKYISNVVHRAEWSRRFGKNSEEFKGLLKQGFQELEQAGVALSRTDKENLTVHTYKLGQAMQKALNPITDPNLRIANNFALGAMNTITLPLVVLSSLTEPMLMLAASPTRIAATLPKVLGNAVHETLRGVFPKIPKSEMTRFAELNGKALDIAVSERMLSLFHGDANPITNTFFKVNGLHQWTRFVNIYANEVGKGMIKNYLKDASKGKLSDRQAKILTDLGIDIDHGIAWVRKGGSELDNFFENVRTGAQRFNSRIVMTARATTKPLYMSDPHWALVAQLKSFPVTFGNTVLKSWYNQTVKEAIKGNKKTAAGNAARISATGIAMVTTAYMINELRDYWIYNGKPPKRSEEEKVMRAIDRVGFMGAITPVIDAARAREFGAAFYDPLIGPGPSRAGKLTTAIGSRVVSDKPDAATKNLAKEIVKTTPFAAALPKKVQKEYEKELTNMLK